MPNCRCSLPHRSTRRGSSASLPCPTTMSVGAYQRLAHDAVDDVLAEGRLPLVVGGTGLYFRAALAELGLPAAEPAAVTTGKASTSGSARRQPTHCFARATPGRQSASTRTIASGSCARSSSPRRASRSHRRPTASGRVTRGCRLRSSRSTSRSRSSTVGSRGGRRRWSSRGWCEEARQAWAATLVGDSGKGARARAVRNAARGRRARRGRAGDETARALPAEVAAADERCRYPRRRPACRGDRR